MLLFYTPSCEKCPEALREYARAEAMAQFEKKPYAFRIINADNNPKAKQFFQIKTNPAYRLLSNGSVYPYDGEMIAFHIMRFLDRQVGKPFEILKTVDSIDKLREGRWIRVNSNFYFHQSILVSDNPQVRAEYENLIRDVPQYRYFITSEEIGRTAFPEIARVPVVVVFSELQKIPQFYYPTIDSDEVVAFVKDNERPFLITEITDEIMNDIFAAPVARKKGIILFRSAFSSDADEIDKMFRNVAKRMKSDDLIFCITDIREEGYQERIAFSLSITEQDLPTLQIINMDGEMKRYVLPEPTNEEKIVEFIKSWREGKVKRFLRSQPIPLVNKEVSRFVVGDNFEDEVLKTEKIVLALFYLPWDDQVKEFLPIFENMAWYFGLNSDYKLVKVDISKNDIPGHLFNKPLTLKLFTAKNKTQPKEYTGKIVQNDIIAFVKENS